MGEKVPISAGFESDQDGVKDMYGGRCAVQLTSRLDRLGMVRLGYRQYRTRAECVAWEKDATETL